jgi:hypothetical protein
VTDQPEFEIQLVTPRERAILDVIDQLGALLIKKNRSYGDSALNPVRIFSKSDPLEQLRVRIDDKLSRLARGHEIDEDTLLDLIGYLVMLKIGMNEHE